MEDAGKLSDPLFSQASSGEPGTPTTARSRIGFLKGRYSLPDNWEEINEELNKEIEELFYGSDIEPSIQESDGPNQIQ